MFRALGDDPELPIIKGVYYTWSLLFAQPPIAFPESAWLRLLFFAVPILGFSFIIDSIVELTRLVRDRRLSEQSWCRIMAQSLHDHVIIVGLGKLGYRSFQILRRLGHRVVVIEQDTAKAFLDDVRAEGSPIILGDARREALLEEAGISKARAIIIATSNDLSNLEIALDARRVAPNVRVVLRMFDQAMADKIAGVSNIHVAMSQSWISAPAFATAAVEPGVVSSVILDNQLIVLQRWTVRAGGALAGVTIADAMTRHGIAIIERKPAAAAASPNAHGSLFPRPDLTLEPGDQILVQGRYETMAELRAKSEAQSSGA